MNDERRNIDTVAIFGAGTMGHGIAQVSANAGYKVILFDISSAQLEHAKNRIAANLQKGIDKGKVSEDQRNLTLANLSFSTSVQAAASQAQLIIEAIPERLELKHRLFQEIEQYAPEGAIMATNTSSISISDIASCLRDPSRVIGAHFFNPVHIMKLLEIVYHTGTAKDVINTLRHYGESIGKEGILVRNSPGFATSRLGVALGMEAIRMLEEGVASAADIDKAMVLGYRHPIGPLRLTDLVGLDVRMNIGNYLAEKLNNAAFVPPQLMQDMVAEGKLGKKTKSGFYKWEE